MPQLADLNPGDWFRLAAAPQSKPFMLLLHEENTVYSACSTYASSAPTVLLSRSPVVVVNLKTEKIN